MITREELIQTFQELAVEVTERKLPTLSGDSVIMKLGIDSLQMLEIVSAMERRFKVTLPDDQLVGIQTIDDLVKLIQRRLQAQG